MLLSFLGPFPFPSVQRRSVIGFGEQRKTAQAQLAQPVSFCTLSGRRRCRRTDGVLRSLGGPSCLSGPKRLCLGCCFCICLPVEIGATSLKVYACCHRRVQLLELLVQMAHHQFPHVKVRLAQRISGSALGGLGMHLL